ncbi:hypothetical protein [Sporomusa sp. KB1]|jgi:hypothetical protein|uniref:hypothetical protein n=1 Tax=Sporomusa sp. KB1 TaxID=943346 RepID=UPI0011A075F6|nr:hypothetical protein [Sporomusa sp. KB1]TWH48710.1 hypothetical protein Salpa_4879 [Sporomusa sp. KB1]
MYSRIHTQSDVLKNGKIMLLVDCNPGCITLTDLEYAEYALREVLVATYKAIQEITLIKNNFTYDAYVNILVSLTNNLKTITESLIALKTEISTTDKQCSTIAESFTQKISIYKPKIEP